MGSMRMRSNRGVMKNVLILVALALLAALALPGPAQAEAIEVPCQLGADLALTLAIEQANNNPGKDTIRLEGECIYGLFAASVYDEGHNGLLVITDELTIEGNGARLERMSGNIRFRLIKATAPLTIEDLTLANGYADDPNDEQVSGGAVHISGAGLLLRDVTVSGNRDGGAGKGGGVYVFHGDARISDSVFENNQAGSFGGGLFVDGLDEGSVVLNGVTFAGNQAGAYGGAVVLVDTDSNTIYGSRFENNEVTGGDQESGGGALAIESGVTHIDYTEFVGNRAESGGAGGAVYLYGGDTVINHTRFENNVGGEAGAISAFSSRITLANSILLDNFSVVRAPGLYLYMRSDTRSLIYNNLWVGNHSPGDGTTIWVAAEQESPDTTRASIVFNTFADPETGFETALGVSGGTVTVANNIIANYTTGLAPVAALVEGSDTIYAGNNLYQIADPARAQVGNVIPYGDGALFLDDPQFVDREGGDYHLLPNSQAIDNGFELNYNSDIEGTARPQGDGYDIGAYEYVPQNAAPVAKNDSYVTKEDTELVVSAPGVLDNDEDADGDTLTAVLEREPEHGTVALEADGSFAYTSASGYVGEDRFTYRAYDGEESSEEATVTITVEAAGTNLPPVAVGDTYETEANVELAVPVPGVLGNDGDANGDALTAVLLSGPAYGQLALNADGSFTYTPDEDFAGEDSFTYQADDGVNWSNEATVRIYVLVEQTPEEPLPERIFLPVFVR